MKFAAIALLAVVMLSADAEAKRRWKPKGVTAKCSIPDSEEEDAIKGGFFLRQRSCDDDENAKPISLSGKVWNAERGEDFTAQLYGDAECGGAADGDAIGIREGRGKWRSTALYGKIGDGSETQISLTDQTDKSIALVNLAGDTVTCCPITDIVDHSAEDTDTDSARLLDAMFDQN